MLRVKRLLVSIRKIQPNKTENNFTPWKPNDFSQEKRPMNFFSQEKRPMNIFSQEKHTTNFLFQEKCKTNKFS